MNKIKSFEYACNALNIQPALPIVDMLPEANQKAVIANYKLDIIHKALNGKWKADWADLNQKKYFPWFNHSSSGVGFSYDDFFYGYSFTDVGSYRVFASSDLAEYAGNQFIELYNDAMSI